MQTAGIAFHKSRLSAWRSVLRDLLAEMDNIPNTQVFIRLEKNSLLSLSLDKPGKRDKDWLSPSMFSSAHLKVEGGLRQEVVRPTARLFSNTWLLRDCTCSNSWLHLHCHQYPFSIGGCYGNAARNCCDMTHNKCKKSRAAVMECGAFSLCVSLLQRGGIFLFSRKHPNCSVQIQP